MASRRSSLVNAAESAERVVWVWRPPPLLLRCFNFAIGSLCLAFEGVAAMTSSVHFKSTTGEWIGSIVLVFGGLLSLEAAFSRGDIRFDPATRDIIIATRGLFCGLLSACRRFSTGDAVAIGLRRGRFSRSPR